MAKQKKVSEAINWDIGLQNFHGDEELFKHYVNSFETCSLKEILPHMYNGIVSQNWNAVIDEAYALQCSARYFITVTLIIFNRYIAANDVCEQSRQFKELVTKFLQNRGSSNEKEILKAFIQLIEDVECLKERLAQLTKKTADFSDTKLYSECFRKFAYNNVF